MEGPTPDAQADADEETTLLQRTPNFTNDQERQSANRDNALPQNLDLQEELDQH